MSTGEGGGAAQSMPPEDQGSQQQEGQQDEQKERDRQKARQELVNRYAQKKSEQEQSHQSSGTGSKGSGQYQYNYQYNYQYGQGKSQGSQGSRDFSVNIPTFVIVLAFIFCWPVGVVLTVLKHVFPHVIGQSGQQSRTYQTTYHQPQQSQQSAGTQSRQEQASQSYSQSAQRQRVQDYERARAQERRERRKEDKKRKRGTRALNFFGVLFVIIGAIGLLSTSNMSLSMNFLSNLMLAGGMAAGGVAMLSTARDRKRMSIRQDTYLSVLAGRPHMRMDEIAGSVGVSERTAKRELLRMVQLGYLRGAFYDARSNCFVMPGNQAPFAQEPEAPKKAEAAPEPQPKQETVGNENARILAQIRSLNNRIEDEEVSRKIDRIELITATIFEIVENKPEKKQQIKSFMNYYLPTTLKILDAYARYEAQSVRGKNIDSAVENIEGILDKLVKAFESQLDRLFMDDVMDISTEIDVLESMLAKDGLAGGKMTMPGTGEDN